jgi:transaldolase/glucose-6-phosphate isomerase
MFARSVYGDVLEAYLSGLEALSRKGSLDSIASVASFFVSRIDSKVDAELDKQISQADGEARKNLEALKGEIAIANAKLAYQHYKEVSASDRWQKLAKQGARPQRLLWASTSTKNKAYPDVIYVDALIGRDTINTLPPETLEAFRDHGHLAASLESDVDTARRQLAQLEKLGISLDRITDELVSEGVEKFAEAADQLFAALAAKRAKILDDRLLRTDFALGDAGGKADNEVSRWTKAGNIRRLWARDKSLWTGADEDRWLGWLDISRRELSDIETLEAFARDVQKTGTTDAVLLGMGGSSLGAEVLADTLGRRSGGTSLHVLDSTDPEQILSVEGMVAPSKTLFIVSSKSGSTLEPNILRDHFLHVTRESEGDGKPGTHFVAITDPGSPLEQEARRDGFRKIFLSDPTIGGRFSVLSKFGLVPAAAIGIDVGKLLRSAECMRESCADMVPPSTNPGVRLGIALGVLARDFHRDKITLFASPELASFGAWLEQLIAESTGKQGKGLIPVDGEALSAPESYGNDRIFVELRYGDSGDTAGALSALQQRGHPVIRLAISDKNQIAQLFFVWEMAIAVAGAVIGINPFDQPDVEAAKQKTRALTERIEHADTPPRQRPDFVHDGVSVFADSAIRKDCAEARSLADCLRLHLNRLSANDYFALLAYMQRNGEHQTVLERLRLRVRDQKRVATCLGFGPRYLHSTGQAYKGGPNSGVFLTLTCDHAEDVPLENRKLSFGTVELAQAQGDFDVLNERGRRAMRVHLHDLSRGIGTLTEAVERALT